MSRRTKSPDKSCERQGTPLTKAASALQAFEIDPEAAEKAVGVVRETLVSLKVPSGTAEKLARSWIKVGDFLEASLCFPIADFVIGNPQSQENRLNTSMGLTPLGCKSHSCRAFCD